MRAYEECCIFLCNFGDFMKTNLRVDEVKPNFEWLKSEVDFGIATRRTFL